MVSSSCNKTFTSSKFTEGKGEGVGRGGGDDSKEIIR